MLRRKRKYHQKDQSKWKDIFIALHVTQCQAPHCNIQSKTHSSIDFYALLACGNTVYANTKQMK